jgi:hypothetical protein
MGIDDTFDGHVDRWDRDESVHQAEEAAQSSNSSADAGSSVPVPTSMPGQDAGK